jgi:hypothetical protein
VIGRHATSQRIRACLALAVVFAAGLAAGVFLERQRSPAAARVLHAAVAEHEARLEELREVVGLDDDQIEQVEGILARNQRIVQLHWEQLRPEVQDAMLRVHQEIAGILRPEQRQRYHEWLKLQRERGERPPGHHPEHTSEELRRP